MLLIFLWFENLAAQKVSIYKVLKVSGRKKQKKKTKQKH